MAQIGVPIIMEQSWTHYSKDLTTKASNDSHEITEGFAEVKKVTSTLGEKRGSFGQSWRSFKGTCSKKFGKMKESESLLQDLTSKFELESLGRDVTKKWK